MLANNWICNCFFPFFFPPATISLKLISHLCYSSSVVILGCFLFLPHWSSRGFGQILNRNASIAPTQPLLPTQWLRNRESGKEGEGGGCPPLISRTTERDRGRMLSYESCNYQAEQNFSGSLIKGWKEVMEGERFILSNVISLVHTWREGD